MNALVLAGWLLASGGAPPDTTVELRRGDRVVVENLSGTVEVQAWDRAALALRGEADEGSAVVVRRVGDRVVVGSGDSKGRGLGVDVRLRLPPWVALEIRGRSLDVAVSGMASEVQVHTVEGDVRASDVSGSVTLASVEGRIEVRNGRGRISARSRGNDVILRAVEGTVEVESGSGDLLLEDLTATSVQAETLDGNLTFQGTLARGGTYRFSVHDGDADLVVPPGTGARARVSTFDGEFVSDFPITLQRYGGGGVFEFTLGDGGADLEVQVFDGEIRLRSAGRRE